MSIPPQITTKFRRLLLSTPVLDLSAVTLPAQTEPPCALSELQLAPDWLQTPVLGFLHLRAQ